MDPAEGLDILLRMQNFDGGFGDQSIGVVQLLFGLGGFSAQEALMQFGIVDEKVMAVVLAWAWIRACCGDDAVDIVEKMDLWLWENKPKNIDVDKVEERVPETHSFEASNSRAHA